MADGPLIRQQDLHGLDPVAPGAPAREAPAGCAAGATTGVNGTARPCAAAMPAAGQAADLEAQHPFLTGDGHIRRLFDIEVDAIAQALSLYRGRMAETARCLGIGRSTLYRKIGDLQLDKTSH